MRTVVHSCILSLIGISMAKKSSHYVCQSCGSTTARWQGRCDACGEWNTIVEEIAVATASKGKKVISTSTTAVPITQTEDAKIARFTTGDPEFDRVTGGGIVPGSALLLGGEPGIGKSTLVLQICAAYAKKGETVLYVSAEESAQQIGLRARRLGIHEDTLLILSQTDVKEIEKQVEKLQPSLVIIDSIQLVFTDDITSAAGTVAQIRESAAHLVYLSKRLEIATIIIGHVTKDGNIAGPKVLEHLVDTVLSFVGDQNQEVRIVRVVKNRFGSTHEIGVYEMNDKGLSPVHDPSMVFTSHADESAPGRILTCLREGNRTLFIEVQALTTTAAVGMPKRRATGMDPNRLNMVVAILEKHCGLQLSGEDVYINVVGGIRVDEPALDLPAALAIYSSFCNRPAGKKLAVGELGLTGEIRPVKMIEQRLIEAQRFGIEEAIIPPSKAVPATSLIVHQCRGIQDAISHMAD